MRVKYKAKTIVIISMYAGVPAEMYTYYINDIESEKKAVKMVRNKFHYLIETRIKNRGFKDWNDFLTYCNFKNKKEFLSECFEDGSYGGDYDGDYDIFIKTAENSN
jgi:hypothetical protein